MSRIVLGIAAERDLDEIWTSLSRQSVADADYWIARLFDTFDVLARTPAIRPTRRDLTDQPVFFWPLGAYLILYRIQTQRIEIVGVTEGPRDIPSFLNHGE
jgi:plasmid stabilization system protein ParE